MGVLAPQTTHLEEPVHESGREQSSGSAKLFGMVVMVIVAVIVIVIRMIVMV